MRYNHFDMLPVMAFRSLGGRMTLEGGGKGGSAPPAPDYVGAANATAAGNKEAAIAAQEGNMINQYTPYGSVTYTQRGTSSSGTPLWSQNVALSPEQQAAYNKDVQMNAALQNVGIQGVGYVQNALNAPLASPGQAVGTAGTTNFITSVKAPTIDTDVANISGMQRSIASPTIGLDYTAQGGPMQMGVANNANKVDFDISNAGKINQGVYQNLGKIKTGTGANQLAGGFNYNPKVQTNLAQNAGQIRTNVQDPNLVQQQVTDALYQQQANILDPQFDRSQSRLENQLANQGITRGSEAWNTAMQEANLQKQQAYESARQSAIGQGVNAAQGLYSSQLAGMSAANQALGQQFGQGVTAQQAYNQALAQQFSQGQSNQQLANQAAAQNNALAQANAAFANQALGQQFSQGIQGQQAQNAAQAQQFAQNQAQQQAYNQALAQQFSQGLQGAQFANTAQQQAYQQQLSSAQLQNEARAQQLQESLAKGQFANEAQAQAYQQELASLQAENAARAQQFSMGLTNAELANQAANQKYAQQLSNAQLANQALQQNFANAQALRQDPINMLNAVRSGSQMQTSAMPQVGVSSPGQLATWSGPDLLGAATAQGQYNQGLYNAGQAASSNQMSGLMGLAGTAAMAGGIAY